uniref:hypothetical protein n=1 Tax=Streptomyces glaucescens TaxID=1907 RepID=UPI001B807D53
DVEGRRPLAPGGTGLTDRALGRDRRDLPTLAPATIVTLSDDHAVETWNTGPSWASSHACRHVRVPLSRAQWHLPDLDHRPP